MYVNSLRLVGFSLELRAFSFRRLSCLVVVLRQVFTSSNH